METNAMPAAILRDARLRRAPQDDVAIISWRFCGDAMRDAFAKRNEGEDRNKWLYSYNPLTVELA
jgi:hypothetical protein